jgi:phosphoserine aminotransferase
LNFNDSGLSILEISHRSKDFVDNGWSLDQFSWVIRTEGKATKLFPAGGASLEFF